MGFLYGVIPFLSFPLGAFLTYFENDVMGLDLVRGVEFSFCEILELVLKN